jgi:hypothetical protein
MTTARLCTSHAKGERDQDERTTPHAPQGAASCPVCLQEVRERDALREAAGTRTTIIDSRTAPLEDYLSGVQSPVARRLLTERRDQELREQQTIAVALDEADALRPLVIEADHAETAKDKRRAARRLFQGSRGPMWRYG